MTDDTNEESTEDNEGASLHITADPDHTDIEQPNTAGAQERASHPFRILLASDLTPQATGAADWEREHHLHSVRPNTFGDFMAEQAPRLSVEVPNTLGDTPASWTLTLTFADLDAFTPAAVARRVEPTAQLMEVRDLVQEVVEGTMTLEEFRSGLETHGVELDWADDLYQTLTADETRTPPDSGTQGEQDEALDRLMGMVDVDEEAPDREAPDAAAPSPDGDGVSGAVSALMDAVQSESGGSRTDPSAAESLYTALTTSIREQVRHVLHHPKVRRLESAWRGLKLLVDRLPVRENVELVVLPVGQEALHEAMHHQVLVPEHSAEHDAPPTSLILVDEAFGHTHRDLDRLTDLAETGESLQTPVVASVGPDFFGMESLSGLRKLPALRPHLQGDAYVEWDRLRETDASQFLALALPSFLLRRPYDGQAEGDLGLQEESGVLGSGALAVAVTAAQSMADTGWPTHLTNYSMEDLPVQSGPGGTSPLAPLLSGRMQSELARAGFLVLGGRTNRDTVQISHARIVAGRLRRSSANCR